LIIVLVGIVLAAGWFWLKRQPDRSATEIFSATGSLSLIRAMQGDGNIRGVERELDRVDSHAAQVPAELKAEFDKIRKSLEADLAASRLMVQNQYGTSYLTAQIRNFEKQRVKTKMDPAWIRVLLKRCRYFRETWPKHEEIESVVRLEERYGEVVDVDASPTMEDIEVEVETLTWARPEKFGEAFAVLKAFMAGAGAEDRERCTALLDELKAEQKKHFDERMADAKQAWESEKLGDAVRELIAIVVDFEDEAMVAKAANELVRLPGVEPWLAGYQRDQPHTWEPLMENRTVHAKARELGLLN
jgi:hypothetical protein